MLDVIIGINWGDEGKGRMVDLLADRYDIVVRYQGGGNAGHTVINEHGEFALHLLPSGIFRKETVNVIGNGVALDIENLWTEIEETRARGIEIMPDNLKISEKASLVLPWHRLQDELEEKRLGNKLYGSTKQGIAPFYADKYQKKTIMAGELFDYKKLQVRLRDLMEWKNLILCKAYGIAPFSFSGLWENLIEYAEKIKPFIANTSKYLEEAVSENKNILFEAQLGSLRDIDYGIYPWTTSSNAIAAYAPIGAGIPFAKIDNVLGIFKPYSTSVGGGPFVTEWHGEEADKLRETGKEYGAKTGRARRVGALDLIATKYGAKVQGTTALAITKMDILGYMDRIPVCTRYIIDGKETDEFPFPSLLDDAEPVYEYLPGWKTDISGIRNWDDLPIEAKNFLEYIEEKIGCHIKYVSVGPEREAYIVR